MVRTLSSVFYVEAPFKPLRIVRFQKQGRIYG